MKEIEKLKLKWEKAIKSGNYSLAANIQNQIKNLQETRINQPVKEIMKEMPKEDVIKASRLCRKIPVYADLLQEVAVELQNILQKTDPSIKILLMDQVNQIRKSSNAIVSIIPSLQNDEFIESFCQLSDRINMIVENVFNEQEIKLKQSC